VAKDAAESTRESESAGTDLASILSSAYEEAAAPEAAGDAAGEGASSGGASRDKRGRFAKPEDGAGASEGETAAAGAEAEGAAAEGAEEPPAEGDEGKAAKEAAGEGQAEETPQAKERRELEDKATARWSPQQKAQFKKFAPEAQAFVLDRFKSMEADYTKKTQAVAALREEYGPVDEMFKPFLAKMQAAGYRPQTLIRAWASVENELTSGDPKRQLGVVQRIIKQYRIAPDAVVQALGVAAAPAAKSAEGAAAGAGEGAAAAAADPNAIPPGLAPWVEELKGIKTWISKSDEAAAARATADRNAEMTRIGNEIEAFRSAKDEKSGAALHPFFDEVEKAMSELAQLARMRGERKTIQDLYDTAVWQNPSTRQKKLAADQAAQRAKDADEARAKAAKARRAGASVTGAPGAGATPTSQPAKGGTLREQLDAAFDDTTSR
jgi:hypothetical protein